MRADGQTHDKANSRFRNFANAHKNLVPLPELSPRMVQLVA